MNKKDRRSYNRAFKIYMFQSEHYSENAVHIPKKSLMTIWLLKTTHHLINTNCIQPRPHDVFPGLGVEREKALFRLLPCPSYTQESWV